MKFKRLEKCLEKRREKFTDHRVFDKINYKISKALLYKLYYFPIFQLNVIKIKSNALLNKLR